MPKAIQNPPKKAATAPLLAAKNDLHCLDTGVWLRKDNKARESISYTDGDASENAVYAAIEAASDRSVDSLELNRDWDKWALQYHLGGKRANIYRGLNLSKVKTVLEVGCGCGAITRFLGEQGFAVDAIEGTLRRAQIARLRTADLPNVQVVSSNYHQLTLPKQAYDLIVFTGVLEYSGAYSDEGLSPEAQLAQTLQSAQQALSKQGAIVIAIENRTGFKYVMGASEDHLNVPYIGLLDYQEPATGAISRGIRTWSKREWSEMLNEQGLTTHSFSYPFPDYKLPEAVLSEHFLQNTRYPAQVLNGIESREYYKAWRPPTPEAIFWKTAADTGSLGEYANSFLITIANQPKRVKELVNFDFVRFASSSRKAKHRYQIRKAANSEQVQRIAQQPRLQVDEPQTMSVVCSAKLKVEPYIDGCMLLQTWFDQLNVQASYAQLAQLMRSYYSWLQARFSDDKHPDLLVDALPQNIVVTPDGQWHLIDQEWQAADEIDADLVFFRAMLNFGLAARDKLLFLGLENAQHGGNNAPDAPLALILNLNDFIHWAFEVIGRPLEAARLNGFVQWEQAMQQEVVQPEQQLDLLHVLHEPMVEHSSHNWLLGLHPIEVQVFWTQLETHWHNDHSVLATYQSEQSGGKSILSARAQLPKMIIDHRYVRVDPAKNRLMYHAGWLDFDSLMVQAVLPDNSLQHVYALRGVDELVSATKFEHIEVSAEGWLSFRADDPKIYIDFAQIDWPEDAQGAVLTVNVNAPLVQDYPKVHHALVGANTLLGQRIHDRHAMLEIQSDKIAQTAEQLKALQDEVQALQQQRDTLDSTPSKSPSAWEKVKKRFV